MDLIEIEPDIVEIGNLDIPNFKLSNISDDEDNIIREKRGLMPRCFEYLFSNIARESQKRGTTDCSLLYLLMRYTCLPPHGIMM